MSLDFELHGKGVCSECGQKVDDMIVFDANITHNLTTMAKQAGIYYALWNPEKLKATKAKNIINILETGLKLLKEKPEHYKKFNSPNGWGTHEHFVPFVEKCLNACKEHPEARIKTDT